jgi:glycosyltransferase involved in cell wall biosynthesis
VHVAVNGWFWDKPFTGSGQYLRQLIHWLPIVEPTLRLTLVLPAPASDLNDLSGRITTHIASSGRSNPGKVMFEQHTFPRASSRVGADLALVPYWGGPLSSPIPVVVSILDVIPLILPDYARGLLPRFYTSLQTAAGRGATHILTISEASKADIVRHLQVTPDRVTVTPLAASDAFHPRLGAERDADVRARYQLPDRYVLYLGGFDVRKRVSQLVAAYAFVQRAMGDEVLLVLNGQPPQWGRPPFPDLPADIARAGVSDNVRWIGRVDEADKPALYRMADVFAFPTAYEGFGLPILEAMASGTPVVANDIPVVQEVVGDAAYLVPDGGVREMAGALLSLLVDDALREDQRTRGLARATHFSWRRTAAATAAALRKVVQSGVTSSS